MNTQDLENILFNANETKKYFVGVFPRDKLPHKPQTPFCLVCNLSKSDHSGSHWTCINVDENGTGLYFDSYGLPPLYSEIRNFMNRNTTSWDYNRVNLQCPWSFVCGHYCVYVLCKLQKQTLWTNILKTFTMNCRQNDVIVFNFTQRLCRRLHLNSRTNVLLNK